MTSVYLLAVWSKDLKYMKVIGRSAYLKGAQALKEIWKGHKDYLSKQLVILKVIGKVEE